MEPRKFITAFTRARHLRYPQPDESSLCPYPTSLRSILILSFNLRLRFQVVSFPQVHAPLLSSIRATCPAYHIHLDLITRMEYAEEHKSQSSSLYSLLHSPVTSSFLVPNILFSTLFSNTFSLRSSLNVRDQVSHPRKTTDKNIS
jgi:hypothetical protein